MAYVTVRFAHGAVLGVLYRPLQCHTTEVAMTLKSRMERGLETASGLGEGALLRSSARPHDGWAVWTIRDVLEQSALLLAPSVPPYTNGVA